MVGRRHRPIAGQLIGQRGLNRPALLVEQADRLKPSDLELQRSLAAAVKQNDLPARVPAPAASVIGDHRRSFIDLTQVKDAIRPEIQVVADGLAVGAGQHTPKGCRQLESS